MSEPENFLSRWSRRKRDAAEAERKDEAARQQNDQPVPPAEAQQTAEGEPFDLESLPSIESIGADTDVSAFLRPGVPPELTRAALRRAWSTDPEIRDFVGLVENGWDFNDPGAMPGFGAISPGEIARLLTHTAVGEMAPEKSPAETPQTTNDKEASAVASGEPMEHEGGDVQRSDGAVREDEKRPSADKAQRNKSK